MNIYLANSIGSALADFSFPSLKLGTVVAYYCLALCCEVQYIFNSLGLFCHSARGNARRFAFRRSSHFLERITVWEAYLDNPWLQYLSNFDPGMESGNKVNRSLTEAWLSSPKKLRGKVMPPPPHPIFGLANRMLIFFSLLGVGKRWPVCSKLVRYFGLA